MIYFIKNSACIGHARVQKFIDFFMLKGFVSKNIIWSRDLVEHPDDIVIYRGGGYGGSWLAIRYIVWVFKLTIFLLRFKRTSKNVTFFAIDFDSAIGCYLASRLRPEIKYFYDVHDEFAIRYNFPNFVKKFIIRLDSVVRKHAIAVIHVDDARVSSDDKNAVVIQNITPDIYSSINKTLNTDTRTFVVSGLLCAQRGLESIHQFALDFPNFSFIVAGNPIDQVAKNFLACKNVTYHGYIEQKELLHLSADASAIFSLYDPSIEINRLAASNKLYDALMLGIPVITNQGVLASNFVEENGVGLVVPFNYCVAWNKLASIDLNKLRAIGQNGRRIYESEFLGSGSFESRCVDLLRYL